MIIKKCLLKLTEQNYDMSINKHVKYLLENLDETQLIYKLSNNGIKIDNNMINLWYYPNIGFKCDNMWKEKYGNLPICGKIERYLNEQLYKINNLNENNIVDQ